MLAGALVLASCGFTPVYQDHSKEQAGDKQLSTKLASVAVKPIDFGRPGQVLHTDLEQLFNPNGAAAGVPSRYTLDVSLERRKDASAIQRDRQITRYTMLVTAKYVLHDRKGGVVTKGQSLITGSFDAASSDFSNYTAEEDTVMRIMHEVAKDIDFQLMSVFLDNDPAIMGAPTEEKPKAEKPKHKKSKKKVAPATESTVIH